MSELTLEERIAKVFEQNLNLVVPSVDTDLFETGSLDSLSFVELLVHLEREYKINIPLQDIELDNFRSIASIAEFIANCDGQQRTEKDGARSARAGGS
jgi:acyl carrier protein